MSDEIGFVSVMPENNDEGSSIAGLSQVSERTRQRIDEEVKRIVGEAHDAAVQLLTENRSRPDSFAEALVHAETLDQPDPYAQPVWPRCARCCSDGRARCADAGHGVRQAPPPLASGLLTIRPQRLHKPAGP